MLPDTQRALCKNAAHIREVQVMREKLYYLFLPSRQQTEVIFPMLNSPHLTMSLQPISSLTFGIWSYIICNLEGGNKSSTKVSLGLFDKNPGQRRLKIVIKMEPKALFSLVTEHVQDLQDLDIVAPWRGDVKALIDNLPECLRTVRLKDGTHQAP
ncbi:hypothetical protein BGX24_007018 [Mortierella sp. AD032]|nr:hypothetical protein BGX24_007018 [Mortierella sp. AD032]